MIPAVSLPRQRYLGPSAFFFQGMGEISCSAEREQAPPCPVCDAGRWSCHRRFVHTPTTPQSSPARDTPVGRTVLVECVPPRRDALRDSGDGTRLEGLPRRHGWQPWRGARPRKVGYAYGSARNSLADTRAPSTSRRTRCGRTPPQVICHGVRSRISTRASARIHSYNELTPPMSAR